MNPELQNIIDVLKTQKTVCLLAPSFPVDFQYPGIILELKKIWFGKIVELTYAAKLINLEYEKILKSNPEKQFICPNCPTIAKMIETKYPELKENIINVASPMVIMNRFVKKAYEQSEGVPQGGKNGEEYKTIFVWPCLMKKIEAKENGVDYAITFKELKEILNRYEENKIPYIENYELNITVDGNPDFDKFYNDYTKVYPLAWWVADTLHVRWILNKENILVVDGPKNIDEWIKKFKENPNIKFLDILFCEGGCIGWPGISSDESIEMRQYKVYEYKEKCKKDKIWSKMWKFEDSKGLTITRLTNN